MSKHPRSDEHYEDSFLEPIKKIRPEMNSRRSQKHARGDDFNDGPLSNSIKKLRLDNGEQFRGDLINPFPMAEHLDDEELLAEAEVSNLQAMNRLLGHLHFQRIERKTKSTRVGVVSPHSSNDDVEMGIMDVG